MAFLRLLVLGLVCLFPLLGCGNPEFVTIAGVVTFDGEPLPEGDIILLPADPQFGPDAGKIIAGKFQMPARPGHHKVVIRAVRLVPGQKGPMGEDAREDYIPAKYNDETTLAADVKAGAKNEFTFPLTSK